MILAHLADLHLGYRAYHRTGPGGINARERDVSSAFHAAVAELIELRPDLVLVAGDVFHTVRPSNGAIADAFRQFARLSAQLRDVPIVLIAGNHDSPRSVETGSILRLLAEIPNVMVADDQPRRIHLEPIETSVLCLPHNAFYGGARVEMEPDASVARNVLMLHGTVAGTIAEGKLGYVTEYGGVLVDAEEIAPQRWDYVALGHYHIATELAPNMWYAGATERTSTNIWAEPGDKGFVSYDTATRAARFHPVPTREVVDLPRLSARRGAPPDRISLHTPGEAMAESAGDPLPERRTAGYLDPAEIDAAIAERIAAVPGGIEGKIVRLLIADIPRELFRELDHRQIRELRAQALHFHVDARRPDVRRVSGAGSPGRPRTLEEEMQHFLQTQWTPSAPGVETARLVELAGRYLDDAARVMAEGPVREGTY